jgi:hypothetical protein
MVEQAEGLSVKGIPSFRLKGTLTAFQKGMRPKTGKAF